MFLTDAAADYCRRHGLKSKILIVNCRRFSRYLPGLEPERIDSECLQLFREKAMQDALSHVTIEKTVTDVCTVSKSITGKTLEPGKRLRQSRPQPQPVPIESVEAVFQVSGPWLRQWLVLTYWTGLRLQDSISAQIRLPAVGTALTWKASKTGHSHQYPLPEWIRPHLQVRQSLGAAYPRHWLQSLVYQHLSAACEAAKVPRFTPQQIRQRSITEWSRANATAGRLIHGCGIGVLSHYIDSLSVLESAAPRVRVPAAMIGDCKQHDTEGTLIDNFRKLDPQAQGLIASTTERLAAG
jgi:hypothetical protein